MFLYILCSWETDSGDGNGHGHGNGIRLCHQGQLTTSRNHDGFSIDSLIKKQQLNAA